MSDVLDLAQRVIDIVGDRAEAQVTVHGGTSSLTRFANSFIHQNVGEEGESISLKVIAGGRIASATTTKVGEDDLGSFVDDAISAASLQPIDEEWPGLAPPEEPAGTAHHDRATAEASPAERAEQVSAFVRAAPDLNAAGYCETTGAIIAFQNTEGQRLQATYTQAVIDGIHRTESSAGSGHAASSRLGDLDGGTVGALAAHRARDGLNPFDTKPGDYEVVLSPECVASMAIFLAVYGFNGKSHAEGQSFAEVGEKQFDERFRFWDDATDERSVGVPFDSEGTPRRRIDFVADGLTTTLSHDRRSAAKANTESTGHFVPGSEVYGPIPSSLFVGAGEQSVEELIADVDRGLYVATFNYCRVLDPKTLVVTGLTRNGTFMIENGEITGAVSGLRFTQSFVEALGESKVLGAGNDARLADSEFGPGMVHAPSLRLASWNFTGGAAG